MIEFNEQEIKAIAEFMGEPTFFDGNLEGYKINYVVGLNEEVTIYPTELKFHESWDWLMPVVDKIKSIPSYDKGDRFSTEFIISGRYTQIKSGSYGGEQRHSNIHYNKIHSKTYNMFKNTYDAVVDYIRWHNENKIQ